jgi:hypothetical protein
MVTVMVSPGVPLPESVGVVSLVTPSPLAPLSLAAAKLAQPVPPGHWHRWSTEHSSVH